MEDIEYKQLMRELQRSHEAIENQIDTTHKFMGNNNISNEHYKYLKNKLYILYNDKRYIESIMDCMTGHMEMKK